MTPQNSGIAALNTDRRLLIAKASNEESAKGVIGLSEELIPLGGR